VVVLWFGGYLRGRVAMLAIVVAIPVLFLTHTRTALIAMVASILVAGLSLIVAKARVRKLFAIMGVIVAIAILTLFSFITTWRARGQGNQQLSDLTGRTTVWSALVSAPRTRFQVLFGMGLSNESLNGLATDSNWLASYNDQGLFGATVCAAILLFLLVKIYLQAQGIHRALALCLVTYVLLASFTEVTFTDVSPCVLDLTVAASLLVPSTIGRGPP
jgi:energy-coupling factor transporter transmembrane protein EcfT